ncbi:MAG: GGDEF domain-containing protein, partial [Proteobacteria bacterium]|nr:GGDEF domain-containing protein [Pseudomonadota bacterium]
LAYTDEPTANEKAASLSHAIGSEAVEWQGVKIPVSVSYGTYTFRGGEDPSGALDAADRAMYARKRKSATGA